jgi:outer membrane protein
MKKLNLIVESVLVIAVIILFTLHFAGNKSNGGNASPAANAGFAGKSSSGTMAYVDMDVIISSYEMYADLQSRFSEKKQLLEAEMNSKSKNYQNSVLDYQNKVQKGLVARPGPAATEMEQKLSAEQQKLIQLRDKYMAQLAEDEQAMKRQILSSIAEFLTPYSKERGYIYVLANSLGSNILYADKTFNVTQDVLKGLNAKYKADKEKDSKKK